MSNKTLTLKPKNHIKSSASDRVFYGIIYTIIGLMLIIVLYPLIYIVSASFSSASSITSGRMWLFPVEISLTGYKYVLQYRYVWIGYRNTILYTVGYTAPSSRAISRTTCWRRRASTAAAISVSSSVWCCRCQKPSSRCSR